MKTLLILLFPCLVLSQVGGFYDTTTEQAGISLRQPINIAEKGSVIVGLRHQRFLTSIDALFGRDFGDEDYSLNASFGLSYNLHDYFDSRISGTAQLSLNARIIENLHFTIYYQPIYNDNYYFVSWQHQIGGGFTFRML